jgi:nucleoid-associated protein YgaU
VLEGGRAPARLAQQAVVRRRLFVVGITLLALVALLFVLAPAAVARIAGGGPPAAGDPSPTVVVQPGDTLWSIAAAVAPDTDVRITVDQLVAINGDSPIVPGQELELP